MIIDFKNGKSVVVKLKSGIMFGREGKRRFIQYTHRYGGKTSTRSWVREIKQIRPGVKV